MGVAMVSDDDMARQKSAIERLGVSAGICSNAAVGLSPYYNWVSKSLQ